MAHWTAYIAGLTGVGVILLILTLVEAFQTSSHAEGMLTQQRKTDEQTLRAYVTVQGANITNILVGGSPTAHVTFNNYGQTPAYNCRAFIAIQGSDSVPDVQKISFPNVKSKPIRQIRKTVIGPTAGSTSAISFSATFNQADIDRIRSGANQIVVAGVITYRDAFKKTRRTIYKMILDHKRIDALGNGKLVPLTKGNRAS